jgi:hypothetical protein
VEMVAFPEFIKVGAGVGEVVEVFLPSLLPSLSRCNLCDTISESRAHTDNKWLRSSHKLIQYIDAINFFLNNIFNSYSQNCHQQTVITNENIPTPTLLNLGSSSISMKHIWQNQ